MRPQRDFAYLDIMPELPPPIQPTLPSMFLNIKSLDVRHRPSAGSQRQEMETFRIYRGTSPRPLRARQADIDHTKDGKSKHDKALGEERTVMKGTHVGLRAGWRTAGVKGCGDQGELVGSAGQVVCGGSHTWSDVGRSGR